MSKIYKHRLDKIQKMNDFVLTLKEEHAHYNNLIAENIKFEKKSLLRSLIYKVDENKKDIFDLAIHLKSIGINQFFEVLKTELKVVDDKQDFLKDFDLEENELKTIELEEKIKETSDLSKKYLLLHQKYPHKVVSIFNKIFEDDIIKDQESIIECQKEKPILYFFNKRKKEINLAIKEYYDIYLENKLITDGFDLYNEYKEYSSLNEKIEKRNQDIYRLKDQLKSLKLEKQIFEKDLEEMRLFNSFNKIRKIVINKFVNFASNIDNLDFYIEKLTNYYEDKESLKVLYVLQLKEEFLSKLLIPFNEIDNKLYENVKEVESIFKYIEFCKYENIDYPYFSNVGYFENRMLSYQKAKLYFFDSFMKKNIIDTNDFEIFFNKFEKKLENNLLKKILSENATFSLFEKIEIDKLKKERDFILNKYNKEY